MAGEYWMTRLDSMNQRQDPDKIPDSYSPLLVNISLDKPGTWAKRKGSDILASTQAGNGVQGLINYAASDQTHTIRAIRSTDLDTYSFGTDSYTQIDAAQFTSGAKISSTNFLNRVYHVSTDDFLVYESGGTCTDVGSGSDRLKANDLCTAQSTLFVSNVTYANGSSQSYQDRVYYSAFDSGNNTASHQLWNTSEASLANSTRYFRLYEPVIGSYSFERTGLSYHFTSSKCYQFDMALVDNQIGPKAVFSEGIANKRAITTCNNWMIFMNRTGSIFAWGGAGNPQKISFELEDDSNGEAIINLIDPDFLPHVAAGSIGNKIYFSLGDITYRGTTITNAVLVGLFVPMSGQLTTLWSLYSYPVKPIIFSKGYSDGEEVLLFGADDVDDVYQMETGTNDVGTAVFKINAFARTKFFVPTLHSDTQDVKLFFVKYRPQASQDTFLKVKYAFDGNYDYSTLSDPDNASPTTRYALVDMYNPDYATKFDDIKVLSFPNEAQGRSISLEVGNDKLSEGFEVSAIGFSTVPKPLDVNPNT